ncbi:myo-inosose-2 dehydratase [Butyricicoccus sp.]|uniref:myo-inosose-2 dehydratase n=1 Tax=Butyricicoccus sp. TaxID=2049021 RepID=UPI003D7EC45F
MFTNKDVKLGICPIGWTNDDMWDLGDENTFQQCISEMRLAGFTGCEIGHKYPSDVKELKEALDLRGMTVASKWFSSFLGTKPFEETFEEFKKEIEYLCYAGATAINISEQSYSIQGNPDLSIFKNKARFTDAEFAQMCDGLNKLAEYAKSNGIRACFHHHMGTCVQTLEETERMLNNTSDDLLLCYDTGHWTFSEVDPMAILNEFPNRIGHVHLKNMRRAVCDQAIKESWSFLKSVRNGAFTVPGDPEGCVDFEPVLRKLDEIGYEGWIMVEAEQDPAKANPFKYAKMAYEYITDLMAK